jgi:hypothetical protein
MWQLMDRRLFRRHVRGEQYHAEHRKGSLLANPAKRTSLNERDLESKKRGPRLSETASNG